MDIKNQLEIKGYYIDSSFLSQNEAALLYSEIQLAFKSKEVIEVNHDEIIIQTLNGQDLLRLSPLTLKVYNYAYEQLKNVFPTLKKLKDQKIGISANYLNSVTQKFRLHFDRNQITLVLYLNTCNPFPLQLYPLIRSDPRISGLKESFSTRDIVPVKVYPAPGLSVIFWGRRTLHGVILDDEVDKSDTNRYSLQFAFDLDESEYDDEDYYGS